MPTSTLINRSVSLSIAAQATADAALARVPSSPFLSSAFTPASGWQFSACGQYLEAGGDGRLSVASDSLSAVPDGWGGTLSAANLADGPDVIAATGRLEMQHKAATATDNTSCPIAYKDLRWAPGVRIAAFVGADDLDEVDQNCGLVAFEYTDQGDYVRIGPRVNSGPTSVIEARGAYSPSDVAIASGDATGGFWVQLHLIDNRYAWCLYSLEGDENSNPWTLAWVTHSDVEVQDAPFVADSERRFRVGLYAETGSNAGLGVFTAWMKALWVRYPDPPMNAIGMQDRPTSAQTQTFPEADLGSASAVFGNTEARQVAQAITNKRLHDTRDNGGTSTVQWRCTRGSSSPVTGSGSYYDPGAIVVQGSGRYLLWEAQGTSPTGVETYSIRLNLPLIAGVS